MECLRRIVNSNDLSPFISLPRSFLNKKIEVLITPVEEDSNDSSELIKSCIEDAKSRYKIVNGKACNFDIPHQLLQQLYRITYEEKPLVSIREDSLKITLFHKGKKNIIDYKNNCPNAVFITEYIPDAKKRIMKISELKINKLSGYFGA